MSFTRRGLSPALLILRVLLVGDRALLIVSAVVIKMVEVMIYVSIFAIVTVGLAVTEISNIYGISTSPQNRAFELAPMCCMW